MNKKLLRLALNLFGLLFLLGSMLFLALRWRGMPDEVPIHFNAAGEIDGWGTKAAVLILPVLGLVVYGLLVFGNRLPLSLWNTPGGRPVRDPEMARIMMAVMGMVFALAFAYMTVCSVLCVPLGRWFMPIFIAGIVLPFIGFVISFLLPDKTRSRK